MPPLLVVGTHNRKKREELVAILSDVGWEIRDLTDWPDAPDVVEDGVTFLDNARKKAVELSQFLGRWVLGEDSGLVVPALDGRPGAPRRADPGKPPALPERAGQAGSPRVPGRGSVDHEPAPPPRRQP